LFLILLACGGIVACAGSNASNGALPLVQPSQGKQAHSPISHVIVIIQENRSFDDFFATFPGANGTKVGQAAPMPSSVATLCKQHHQPVITKPTSVPLTKVDLFGRGFPKNWDADQDLAHDYQDGYLVDCDAAGNDSEPGSSKPCDMDGFDAALTGANGEGPLPTCTYTYQYVDPSDIAPYWDMAKQYALADDAFQTQGSESFTAHQALIAGGTEINSTESIIDDPSYFPWGCDGNPAHEVTSLLTIDGQYLGFKGPFPCLTYYPSGKTIRDLLDAKGISWKFYAEKVYNYLSPKSGTAGIWSAFDAIKAVRESSEWGTKVVWPDTKIFGDIKNGALPAVAWVTPDGSNSDHPYERNSQGIYVDNGPSWVASIVNAVGESEYWKSSAIVVLWDDWGGFYDHVPPPFYDDHGGLGFRFPMIVISPYVKAHVDHTQYETASVLKFIEDNWGLSTLGQEDERATSIGEAFDFSMPPRSFQKIPATYSREFFLNQKPSGIPPDDD
jgi:phospholipase C